MDFPCSACVGYLGMGIDGVFPNTHGYDGLFVQSRLRRLRSSFSRVVCAHLRRDRINRAGRIRPDILGVLYSQGPQQEKKHNDLMNFLVLCLDNNTESCGALDFRTMIH